MCVAKFKLYSSVCAVCKRLFTDQYKM